MHRRGFLRSAVGFVTGLLGLSVAKTADGVQDGVILVSQRTEFEYFRMERTWRGKFKVCSGEPSAYRKVWGMIPQPEVGWKREFGDYTECTGQDGSRTVEVVVRDRLRSHLS